MKPMLIGFLQKEFMDSLLMIEYYIRLSLFWIGNWQVPFVDFWMGISYCLKKLFSRWR